jgi:Zn finger protein HypA/HybF involved in hydrogenase expression
MGLVKNYEVTDEGTVKCLNCGHEETRSIGIWAKCPVCGVRSWFVEKPCRCARKGLEGHAPNCINNPKLKI